MGMNVSVIPQGEQKVVVELTVKEAMALSGFRFNQDPKLSAQARRHVKEALDSQLLSSGEKQEAVEETSRIRYEQLTH